MPGHAFFEQPVLQHLLGQCLLQITRLGTKRFHLIGGGLGARALNVSLQAALNPPVDDISVERFGFTYRVGDKVMQTDNDYDKEVLSACRRVPQSRRLPRFPLP